MVTGQLVRSVGTPETILTFTLCGDGTMLATADKAAICLWDTSDGRQLRSCAGAAGVVRHLAFADDGAVLVSWGEDGVLRRWDTGTGSPISELRPGIDTDVAALSCDGRLLACRRRDAIELFDGATGATVRTLGGPLYDVSSLTFSPDGTLLAVCERRHLRLVDVASGEQVLSSEGYGGSVEVAFAPDGRTLAAAGARAAVSMRIDGKPTEPDDPPTGIEIWDTATARQLCTFDLGDRSASSLAFSPDGRTLAARAGSFRFWDLDTGQERPAIGCTQFVVALAYSPDGRTLVTGGTDSAARCWQAQTGRELRALRGSVEAIYAVGYSPDGGCIAIAGKDGGLDLWDTAVWSCRSISVDRHWFCAVDFSPDGRTLVCAACSSRELFLVDVATGECRKGPALPVDGACTLALSKDGALAAVGFVKNVICLCDMSAGTVRRQLEGHRDWVRSVAFSPDGRRLASCGADRTVRLWDVSSGAEIRAVEMAANCTSVSFSPDGSLVAAGSARGPISLWCADTGEVVHTFDGDEGGTMAIVFSPTGNALASAGGDTTAMIWSLSSLPSRATH